MREQKPNVKLSFKGPWSKEPDRKSWKSHGLCCRIERGCTDYSVHLCGYVGIPRDHPLFGKDYSDIVTTDPGVFIRKVSIGDDVGIVSMFCNADKVDPETNTMPLDLAFSVHGGITYSGRLYTLKYTRLWWFGFDCSHCDDLTSPDPRWSTGGVYRDMEFVTQETERLARQLSEWPGFREGRS